MRRCSLRVETARRVSPRLLRKHARANRETNFLGDNSLYQRFRVGFPASFYSSNVINFITAVTVFLYQTYSPGERYRRWLPGWAKYSANRWVNFSSGGNSINSFDQLRRESRAFHLKMYRRLIIKAYFLVYTVVQLLTLLRLEAGRVDRRWLP